MYAWLLRAGLSTAVPKYFNPAALANLSNWHAAGLITERRTASGRKCMMATRRDTLVVKLNWVAHLQFAAHGIIFLLLQRIPGHPQTRALGLSGVVRSISDAGN